MIFPYLYTDMSFKRAVILSILSVSALVAHASAVNDTIAAADTIRFDDGAWYVGEIADSLFNGYGKMFYADSTVYEGEWKDGLWDGQGELFFPDGDSYKGEFSQHEFSGYGTYRYSDGAKYEGYWQSGLFNGNGTMTYADGSIYAGEWKDDRKDGIGVFYESQSGLLLKGNFSNDMFIGSFDHSNGISYSNPNEQPQIDFFADPIRHRPDSCWHWQGDTYIYLTYGTGQVITFSADFYTSKRFYAGFSIGFNTINRRIGEAAATYDQDTGIKNTLVGWDWYLDEIMTEHTYTMLKLAGQCGLSWGWFSLGASAGIGLQNAIRNCRSLEHNDSYFSPGTLYYREKVTGVKFAYDIYTDILLSRSIPYINSVSVRSGYSNIDGIYVGAGISF